MMMYVLLSYFCVCRHNKKHNKKQQHKIKHVVLLSAVVDEEAVVVNRSSSL
jgi:hypothetical protein